jgi:CubicO group peptidase (beta-lactamase class C family)
MAKSLFFPVIIFSIIVSCTSSKRSATAPQTGLPSIDTFRTAELLFLTPEKQLLYYQNAERILPTNKIEAANTKHSLIEEPIDLSGFSFSFRDTMRTLRDFIKATKVVGLIVLKNDTILYEQYNDGTGQKTKWVNFSVAKSVTSLLYGAALQDGYIQSLDQKVTQFIPELAGGVYDSVSIKNLLQMSSGVAWSDDPRTRESDLMKVGQLESSGGWPAVAGYLSQLQRAAPAGTKFNYNTIETNLAALILSRSIKKPLATYLSEKIWKPFGMHHDANWITSRSLKLELGGCCISATLRDYALLGLFAMNNGIDMQGKQVLTPHWMHEATTSAASNKQYGYYWWLRPGGVYFASGSFGQQIEIDPQNKIVIAVQSYWPTAFSNYHITYLDAMLEAMINKIKVKK